MKCNVRPNANKNRLYPFIMIIIIIAILTIIEIKYPYFFLQDDNRDSYLPYFVHSYESLLNGEIAFYNFHQFQGIPAFGQTGSLYPVTYIAVFMSKLIFKHYYAAIDIYVFIHLIIGAIGIYKLIEFILNSKRAALYCGITWSLSSYIIYASNSWVIVSTVAAYFPFMIYLSLKLQTDRKLRIAIYLMVVRLLLFYTGHIQYFVYSVIFEFLTTLLFVLYTSSPSERRNGVLFFIKNYFIGYLYVLILSLPLLLPLWDLVSASGTRSAQLSFLEVASQYFPVEQLCKSLFFPFTTVKEGTVFGFRNLVNLSHISYSAIFLLLYGVYIRYIKKGKLSNNAGGNLFIFVLPAILALLWATSGVFNFLIYSIPILNRFRWPFKVILYFDFYLILSATIILNSISAKLKWKAITKKIIFIAIIAIQVLNYGLLYTCTPYKDFGEHHGDDLPLKEERVNELNSGRIVSIGFDIWSDTAQNDHSYITAPTLGFNYCTLWGLDNFAGYEIILSAEHIDASLGLNFTAIMNDQDTIPVEVLRNAGASWYIVAKEKAAEVSSKLSDYGIYMKFTDNYRVILYDPYALPMIYDSSFRTIDKTNYKENANSLSLELSVVQPEYVTFNYIYHPYFKAYCDGYNTEIIPTSDYHFKIYVEEGCHQIAIKYENPYLRLGVIISSVFLVLNIVILYIYILRSKRHVK